MIEKRQIREMMKIMMMVTMVMRAASLIQLKHCISWVLRMLNVVLQLEIRMFLWSVRMNLHTTLIETSCFV